MNFKQWADGRQLSPSLAAHYKIAWDASGSHKVSRIQRKINKIFKQYSEKIKDLNTDCKHCNANLFYDLKTEIELKLQEEK